MIENLPVNENFPAEKGQSKIVKWINNRIFTPVSRRINWLLDLFIGIEDGEGGEFAPGFGPVSYIDFDITYTDGSQEGRLQWNPDDGTLEVGMPGGNVNLQIGQEMLVRVTNDTGLQIDNGTPVYISDATGTNIKVTPADADFAGGVGLRTFAVTTEDIAGGQKGYVTTQGFVRDIDTSFAVAAGMPAYLAVGGGFTTTTPAAPNISYLVGIVTIAHASAGEMYVIQTSIPNLNQLSDVVQDDPKDGDILTWDNSAKVWQNDFPTIKIPIVLTTYDPSPARASESNIHGGILSLATGDPLDSVPTDIVVTKGIGKILIIVNAGSDIIGDILITGESIDRDTGVSTPGDTDIISVDMLSTDGSTTDTNGNTVHSFDDGYISAKWFTGLVTLSTANLTLTDVDVYHLSFEQFNGEDDIVLDTFDVNLLTTNVNAEFDAYLYDIHVESASKCNIENHANLHVGSGGETAIADKYWRLRRGNIAQPIDGSTDGVWIDVHYSNPGAANVEDVTMKIWATKTQVLGYEEAPPSDLLLEDGDSLLLENGDKVLLES